MKKMTKIAVVLMAVFTFGNAYSQIDVKANLLGFAFNDYGLYGEYSISENMSAQLGVMYNRTTFNLTSTAANITEKRVYSGMKVIPSFRFYFGVDDPTEGFFVEPYVRFKSQKFNGGHVKIPVDNNGNYDSHWADDNNSSTVKYEERTYSVNRSKAGFGIAFGRKWVHDSGFLFETFGGFGKNTPTKVVYSDKDVQDYYNGIISFDNPIKIHFRIGASIGWRF